MSSFLLPGRNSRQAARVGAICPARLTGTGKGAQRAWLPRGRGTLLWRPAGGRVGRNRFMKTMRYKIALLSLLSLPAMLLVAAGGPAAAAPHHSAAGAVTSSSLGSFKPTFTGPAATGCASPGCHLLTGPFARRPRHI